MQDLSGPEPAASKLKVFLSYSRKDAAFAQELLTSLELLGFDAYLDKDDIAPGEPWEERLANLIRQADTVVFVISPNSLASGHCAWEVEQTGNSGKRLVPVIQAEVPNESIPDRLRKLNYVYFSQGRSFAKALGELASALRVDATWIREHTRYGELAQRWAERGQPADILLRGSDLEEAKRWAVRRPSNAPEISATQHAYVAASSKAAEDELAARLKLRWRVQAGLLLATLLLAALAGFALVQWLRAEETKTLLAQSNTRLERKLALRAAPRGYLPYDVPAGWFQVATRYAGAVAFVEKRSEPGRLWASGVLIKGSALRPGWTDAPVFVTAIYVVSRNGFQGSLAPGATQIVLLDPRNERRPLRLGEVLWQSETLGISVSSVPDPLPADATPLTALPTAPLALKDLPEISVADLALSFDENAMLKVQRQLRAIVFVGNLEGRAEVAISISHLLGRRPPAATVLPGATANIAPLPPGLGRSLDPQPVSERTQPDIIYTHGTLPGGGGSPIFDAATGDLIGIHLVRYPCPPHAAQDRHCSAAGSSIPRLLAAMRAE